MIWDQSEDESDVRTRRQGFSTVFDNYPPKKKKVNIYEFKKKLSWKDEKKNEWNFRMKNITHAIKNFLNWLIF